MEQLTKGFSGSMKVGNRLVGVTSLPMSGIMIQGIRRDGMTFEDTRTTVQTITFSDEAGLALFELLAEWKETL